MRTTTRSKKVAAAVPPTPTFYGMVAEFSDADSLLHAAEETNNAGYTRIEAYTPFPIHGLDAAVGYRSTRLPWVIFAGGMIGLALGFLMVYYSKVLDYPLVISGRPYFNWQTVVPILFEVAILFAAFATVFGLLASCRMPEPYHPIFNTPNFERASQDAFFLCIEASDPQFDRRLTRQFLEKLHPKAVSEVDY